MLRPGCVGARELIVRFQRACRARLQLQPCPPSVQPAPQLTLHRTRRLRRLRRAVLCQRGGPSAPAQPSSLADSRMDLNGGHPPPAAPLQLAARDGRAAPKRSWRQQELPDAERLAGTPGRSRMRLWRSRVAARLWRHAGRDTRSLRPLCRAFALDSAQQLQARLLCLVTVRESAVEYMTSS